ncbi:MAG TPA: TMEM175 family protein [Candidatus Eisenbacteria bacterium]|nr:TMEM175 family protein [Candidatus Eisenbacteria bacterium]
MTKGRLEAFSDGVIAIVITIMVLELKVPHGSDLAALRPLLPVLLSYILSFMYLAIYWNNHHHTMQAVHHVNGNVLWANLHLLFWLSLFPVATAWLGENPREPWPVACYGLVLLLAAIAYFIWIQTLLALHGTDSPLGRAIGRDFKGKISVVLYAAAVPLAFVHVLISIAIYNLVAILWIVPDPRIEKTLER